MEGGQGCESAETPRSAAKDSRSQRRSGEWRFWRSRLAVARPRVQSDTALGREAQSGNGALAQYILKASVDKK